MNDQQAIQGLWRLVSYVSRGKEIHSSATHYLYSGDREKEIVPSMVDDGKVRTIFRLDEETDPKQIVVTMDWNGPDGPPAANPLIRRGFYRLVGDDLEICFGIAGEFPASLSDEHGLMTLRRDHGPVPETRKPSGTPPIEDDVLGTLTWDDNLNWFSGKFTDGRVTFEIFLKPDDTGSIAFALERARHVVQKRDEYIQLAKSLAAENLLDLANEWNEDDEHPLTAEDFMLRITLESMVFAADGGLTFYHNDGDMFWGHSVQLCIDKNDRYASADIPG